MKIKDNTEVLRLVWHPAHFQNGKLIGSAFDSSDLRPDTNKKGEKRYISVDERTRISKESVDSTISRQQRNDLKEQCQRFEARFARFRCGDLRRCSSTNGLKLFEVTHEPIFSGKHNGSREIPENKAHCAIRNVSGCRKRSRIDELRTALLKNCKQIHPYDDIFPVPLGLWDRVKNFVNSPIRFLRIDRH